MLDQLRETEDLEAKERIYSNLEVSEVNLSSTEIKDLIDIQLENNKKKLYKYLKLIVCLTLAGTLVALFLSNYLFVLLLIVCEVGVISQVQKAKKEMGYLTQLRDTAFTLKLGVSKTMEEVILTPSTICVEHKGEYVPCSILKGVEVTYHNTFVIVTKDKEAKGIVSYT